MTRVIVDDALRSKLHPLELCDSAGVVLARVEPANDLSEYEAWEPEFTEEELRAEEQSTENRFTTAEVLAYLKSLDAGKAVTRVIVDEVLRSKLHNLRGPLELCDASGVVVGRIAV